MDTPPTTTPLPTGPSALYAAASDRRIAQTLLLQDDEMQLLVSTGIDCCKTLEVLRWERDDLRSVAPLLLRFLEQAEQRIAAFAVISPALPHQRALHEAFLAAVTEVTGDPHPTVSEHRIRIEQRLRRLRYALLDLEHDRASSNGLYVVGAKRLLREALPDLEPTFRGIESRILARIHALSQRPPSVLGRIWMRFGRHPPQASP